MDVEWTHAIVAGIGVLFGIGGTVFACGRWVGRIEGRLKESIDDAERRLEDKVANSGNAFDETLRGLRQKINDVEKDALVRFLPKEEFNDFRTEYREDMRDLKALIRNGHG